MCAGPSILVAPVLEEGAKWVQVELPGGGLWYEGTTGATVDAGEPALCCCFALMQCAAQRCVMQCCAVLPCCAVLSSLQEPKGDCQYARAVAWLKQDSVRAVRIPCSSETATSGAPNKAPGPAVPRTTCPHATQAATPPSPCPSLLSQFRHT